jgi:ABC-type multidrug transport system fused ATPase/permease subunit
VSSLDAARTIKLAARIPQVHAHLQRVDAGRITAAILEHRVQAVLDGVPTVMIQVAAVTGWLLLVRGVWPLATTLLVTGAVAGFGWFGQVSAAVVTEAPGTRAWLTATARFADGADLTAAPPGVDLVAGTAPLPAAGVRQRFERLDLRDVSVIHEDGAIGVTGVDLTIKRGELVLLLGQVGSGKSSLLAGLAGLVHIDGSVSWNGVPVTDRETFLRPGRIAYVSQVPRVLSGSFADNVRLDHAERAVEAPLDVARMTRDVADAGGVDALVGHRGVRLSGGQVQRLALARAIAADAEVLLADDVSSALDAATEIELWSALRTRGLTVLGSSSKEAALARADRVVVLVDGRCVADGPWAALAGSWGYLAG